MTMQSEITSIFHRARRLLSGVKVGEGTHIGIGASVIPQMDIGPWSVIGAGAAVISRIPGHVTAVGVPARVIPLSIMKKDDFMQTNKRIYLSPPHMSGKEQEYIAEAFRSNWIAPLGPLVNSFEARLAEYAGVKSAAAVSSGTAAIHLALRLAGVKKETLYFVLPLRLSLRRIRLCMSRLSPFLLIRNGRRGICRPLRLSGRSGMQSGAADSRKR